jgi:hypothetical protein
MIVKCVSKYPDSDQLKQLGPKFFKDQDFHVTVGKEYIVFGLTVALEPDYGGLGLSMEILSDYENLVDYPACLFEIVEGTVSRHWELRVGAHGVITLWPPSFYKDYYHDRLSEGMPEFTEDFVRVRAMIEAEAIGRQLPQT